MTCMQKRWWSPMQEMKNRALVTLEGVGLIGALDISPDPLNLVNIMLVVKSTMKLQSPMSVIAVTISDISQLGDGFELAVTDALL